MIRAARAAAGVPEGLTGFARHHGLEQKARHLAHQTFNDVEALDREIHTAVEALNRERNVDSLVNWRISA
jgi:hypothetical protein